MDETQSYVTGPLISPKNQVERIPGQFINKIRNFSHQKNALISL